MVDDPYRLDAFMKIAGLAGLQLSLYACVMVAVERAAKSSRAWMNGFARAMLQSTPHSHDALDALSKRYPTSCEALAAWCELAKQEEDWSEFQRRAAIFEQRFPRNIYGYAGGIEAALRQHDFTYAEERARCAKRLCLAQPRAYFDHGMVAFQQVDQALAQQRFFACIKNFPEFPRAYVFAGISLMSTGRFEQAEVILLRGMKAFPDDEEQARWFAHCASRRQDWDIATERWQSFRARFDWVIDGYVEGCEALVRAGRVQEAHSLAKVACFIYPGSSQCNQLATKLDSG